MWFVPFDQVVISEESQDYLELAFCEQKTHDGFPAKRTYLGSAAQVFHLLKADKKHIRMTLFEMNDEAAGQLFQYFRGQERTCAVLTGISDDASWFNDRLPQWWDEAADRANDDLVMIVQGDSYALARSLWKNSSEKSKPDLVFVDPFKLEDSNGQPEGIIALSLGLILEMMDSSHVEGRFWEQPVMASLGVAQIVGWRLDKVAEERRRPALKTGLGSARAHGAVNSSCDLSPQLVLS